MESVMKSIMQMHKLKRLDIYMDQPDESMKSLVLQNSSSLQALYFPGDLPTADGDGSPRFLPSRNYTAIMWQVIKSLPVLSSWI